MYEPDSQGQRIELQYCGKGGVGLVANFGELFYDVGHPTPQGINKTLDVSLVGEILRVTGAFGELGGYLVSVNFRDSQV